MLQKQLDVFSDIPKQVVIEPCCSTQRAASLLQVSSGTLNRAKRSGKIPYRRDAWEAYSLEKQDGHGFLWQVKFYIQNL